MLDIAPHVVSRVIIINAVVVVVAIITPILMLLLLLCLQCYDTVGWTSGRAPG